MHIRSKFPPDAKKVFSGVSFDIYQWQQELYDGSFTTFEIAKGHDAVGIIPVIDDTVVILHEEQPTHAPRVSFPGGHIEDDEDPLTTAIRELKEETGMTFKTFKLVDIEDQGGDRLDCWVFRFIATDLVSTTEPHSDPGERIAIENVHFEQAKKYAKNNVYMPNLINRVNSLEELLALPELSYDNR